jgi:hypothetical protein
VNAGDVPNVEVELHQFLEPARQKRGDVSLSEEEGEGAMIGEERKASAPEVVSALLKTEDHGEKLSLVRRVVALGGGESPREEGDDAAAGVERRGPVVGSGRRLEEDGSDTSGGSIRGYPKLVRKVRKCQNRRGHQRRLEGGESMLLLIVEGEGGETSEGVERGGDSGEAGHKSAEEVSEPQEGLYLLASCWCWHVLQIDQLRFVDFHSVETHHIAEHGNLVTEELALDDVEAEAEEVEQLEDSLEVFVMLLCVHRKHVDVIDVSHDEGKVSKDVR